MHAVPDRWQRWSLLWLLLMLVCALPPPSARAQAPRVAQVDVVGTNRINRETVLAVISTKAGDELSAEQLERDRRAIEALGWFKVVAPPAVSQVPGGARVVFVVTEWPILNEVQISGNTVFDTAQIQALIKTKTGQVFNLAQWQQDVAAIENLYKTKSFVAQVLDNLDSPEFAETGVLKAQVLELSIEAVRVTGLHKTKSYVVTRVLRQKAGKLYNTQKMAKDYQTLRALDFFESINSRVDVSQPGKVVVTWEFKEKRTGQASVGLGYSPQESLVGRAEISENNLFGRGQSVSLGTEIGTRVGGPSFELSFNEPYFRKDGTSLGLSVYDKLVYRFSSSLGSVVGAGGSTDLGNYFERHLGGQVSFGRPFKLPVVLTFRHDEVTTNELPKVVDFPRQDGSVSSASVRYTQNTRDYANNPTTGALNSLYTETGYAQIKSGQTDSFGNTLYQKLLFDVRRYVGLKHNPQTKEPEREQASQKIPVVAFRVMGGTSFGRLPYFEQFFIGGADSLRGYTEDRFWGQHIFLASAEYRRPLANRITGVLFGDIGDAWGSLSEFRFTDPKLQTQFSQHAGFRPSPDVGVGLRVATPIGPIRLDYGFGTEGGHANFSIGHSF